jgi:hypothetical protein
MEMVNMLLFSFFKHGPELLNPKTLLIRKRPMSSMNINIKIIKMLANQKKNNIKLGATGSHL